MNIKRWLVFFIVNLVSICIYSQMIQVELINNQKYSYDDSILRKYNSKDNIVLPSAYFETLHTIIDSIAINVLFLNPKDRISVLENIIQITKDNLFGFMSLDGDIIVQPKYERVYRVNNTNSWIVCKNKWGLINPLSTEVIQFDLKYSSLNTLGGIMYGDGNSNRYIGSLNGLYGVVDSLENVIIPFDYSF